jgi:hypothetical protein
MASDRACTSGITGIIGGDSLGGAGADGSRRLSRSVVTAWAAPGLTAAAPLS